MNSVVTPFREAHWATRKGQRDDPETINHARIGVEACEAFIEGPAAFADFVRSCPSPHHCMYFKR
jgi:hypothetical protein